MFEDWQQFKIKTTAIARKMKVKLELLVDVIQTFNYLYPQDHYTMSLSLPWVMLRHRCMWIQDDPVRHLGWGSEKLTSIFEFFTNFWKSTIESTINYLQYNFLSHDAKFCGSRLNSFWNSGTGVIQEGVIHQSVK